MIQWMERVKVEKEAGHVTYMDLYKDTVTGVLYIGHDDVLVPRYNADGTLMVANWLKVNP